MILNETFVTPPTNTILQLEATAPDGSNNVDWTSSDESVAAVDENDSVTVKCYGKAVISAVLSSDQSIKGFCVIYPKFHDVNDAGQYYYKPVYWAADNGITAGYDKVYFGPKRNCTRRELIIFLWRFAGKPYAEGTLPFNDMGKYNASTDTYQAVLWAYTNGIVKGYSGGSFRPDSSVFRKDTMIMLYRLAGKPETDGTMKFDDVRKLGVSPASDTYRSIVWGTETGITKGYSDGSFKPTANCLREHIVTFIYRYNQNETPYEEADTDNDLVPDYLEEYFGSNPFFSDSLLDQRLGDEYTLEELIHDNPTIPFVTGTVSGSINDHVTVAEASIPALENHPAIVGKPVLLETDYEEGTDLQLNFEIDPNDSRSDLYMICRYENSELIPTETVQYDGYISTNAQSGNYVVVDAEKLLIALGIPIQKYTSSDLTAEEIIDDGSWVILSDFQFIHLTQPLDPASSFSSDADSLSNAQELGSQKAKDVKPFIDWVLDHYDVPEGMYDDPTTVDVYEYISNPVLDDTDYDGRNDDEDACPADNSFYGTLKTSYSNPQVSGNFDYRWFDQDNSVYNSGLSKISSLMSSVIYENHTLGLRDAENKD